jgi:phospholipid-binding lipoprotein MlaA
MTLKSVLPSLVRILVLALGLGALISLGGCATLTGSNPSDPLEPVNRKVWQFNDSLDRAILKPVATAYRKHVPSPIRTGVGNFFGNLGDAWSFVNNALQFKGVEAEESFARFHINTFFGLGGIFDVASDLNIQRHREDFGQTLGYWGAPAGAYLVLPFFGPSTVRDTIALPADQWGDLAQRVDTIELRNSLAVLRAIDSRSNLLRASSLLEGAALDPYSFTRDAYLQYRRAQVLDGRDEPDESPPEDRAPPPGEADAPQAPAEPAQQQQQKEQQAPAADSVQAPAPSTPNPQNPAQPDARQPAEPQPR